MNFNSTKPCANCPFRTDIKPFLTIERAEEIAASIVDQQQAFLCHKTTVDTGDGERVETGSSEHCAGALIMLEHMERPNQVMRIAERLGMYDRRNLKMDSPVFDDADEWIDTQEVW